MVGTAYRDKRTALLQAGLVFIELDYLHHQPPTVSVPVPSPYRIVMIDPRPEWLSGEGRVYPIRVDEPLPTLTIPLNTGDRLPFDFDAPYQQTFEALYFGDEVDYSVLPPAWEQYTPDDQVRLLSRLLAIRDGTPVEMLPLDAALRRWEML